MTDKFTRQYAVRKPDGTLVASPFSGKTVLWDTREAAEEVIIHFREHAAEMGITEWLGEIVHCYMSPFVSERDDGQQLITELQAWMRTQGGTR